MRRKNSFINFPICNFETKLELGQHKDIQRFFVCLMLTQISIQNRARNSDTKVKF